MHRYIIAMQITLIHSLVLDMMKPSLLTICFAFVTYSDITSPDLRARRTVAIEAIRTSKESAESEESYHELAELLRETFEDDWSRMDKLLRYTNLTDSLVFTRATYKAIWLELGAENTTSNIMTLLKFHRYVHVNVKLTEGFRHTVRQRVLNQTANIIWKALYAQNPQDYSISDVTEDIMWHMDNQDIAYIFNQMFGKLPEYINATDLVERLYMIPLTSKQLAIAYIELSGHKGFSDNHVAKSLMSDNLVELYARKRMSQTEIILRKATTIRILSRAPLAKELYIAECAHADSLCIGDAQDSLVIKLERQLLATGKHLFSFSSRKDPTSYISPYQLSDVANGNNTIVGYDMEPYWWNVIPYKDTVAIQIYNPGSNGYPYLCAGYAFDKPRPVLQYSDGPNCWWQLLLA